MLDYPDNPEQWLETAQEKLTEIQAERARLNMEHENLIADIVQVRVEIARRAIIASREELLND